MSSFQARCMNQLIITFIDYGEVYDCVMLYCVWSSLDMGGKNI